MTRGQRVVLVGVLAVGIAVSLLGALPRAAPEFDVQTAPIAPVEWVPAPRIEPSRRARPARLGPADVALAAATADTPVDAVAGAVAPAGRPGGQRRAANTVGSIEGWLVTSLGGPGVRQRVELVSGAGDEVLVTARSTATGRFRFSGLSPGSYRVRVSAGFGQTFGQAVAVDAGQAREVQLMVGHPAVVWGQLDACPGAAVAGPVCLRLVSLEEIEGTNPAVDMRLVPGSSAFHFEAVPPGPQAVFARVPGVPVPVGVAFEALAGEQLGVTLPAFGGPLAGRVVRPDGVPVAGAKVAIASSPQPPVAAAPRLAAMAASRWHSVLKLARPEVTTGLGGAFEFACLPAGRYVLRIERDGRTHANVAEVRMPRDASAAELRITLGE